MLPPLCSYMGELQLCQLCPSLPQKNSGKLPKPSKQKSKRINRHLPCRTHAKLSQAAAGCMHTCWRTTDVSRPSKPRRRLRVDAGLADAMCGEREALCPIIPLVPATAGDSTSFCSHSVLDLVCTCAFPPEHQNHARELVRKADLTQWDALVIMSGDGLLFEVGSAFREDQ